MNNDLISRKALAEELSSLTMVVTGLRAGKGVLREFMTEYQKSVLRIVDEAPAVNAAPEWISVEERLPDGEVLAANFTQGTHGYKEYIIGYVSAVKCTEPDWYSGKCYAENDHEILDNVTHWMPLPQGPKEEER